MGEIAEFIRQRPALHSLCTNVTIQSPIRVGPSMSVLPSPLPAMGSSAEAVQVEILMNTIAPPVPKAVADRIREQGEKNRPVVLCTVIASSDGTPDEVELAAAADMDRLYAALAWAAGTRPVPFAIVAATPGGVGYKLTNAYSPKPLYHLLGRPLSESLAAITTAARADERFSFALALYADTLSERNPRFFAARCFNCMEALASGYKATRKSRDAVRLLFAEMFPDGPNHETNVQTSAGMLCVDIVELCGQLRDQIFHGSPVQERRLSARIRPAFREFEKAPSLFRSTIQWKCADLIDRVAKGIVRRSHCT